jgi:HEPN superfamily AbiU2-like protein
MNANEVFRAWTADLENIRHDIHELFALRRTFRDVYEVFKNNRRLQEVGNHLWDWMLLNYAASVLIRIRRQAEGQKNTIDLDQLLRAIACQPDVITRGRRAAILGLNQLPAHHQYLDNRAFTDTWVRTPSQAGEDHDHVDRSIVQADLGYLQDAVQRVAEYANRKIAHRTRVAVNDLSFADIDRAFDAIETLLKKYHLLLTGTALYEAEPVPQFNTHEVFTFAWIEPRPRRPEGDH